MAPVKNQRQCNSYSSWTLSLSIPAVTVRGDNALAFAEENATCTEDSYSFAVTKGTRKV